jgi:hypothetical protein
VQSANKVCKWRHNFRDHFESLLHLGAMLKCNNYFVMRMNNDDVIWTILSTLTTLLTWRDWRNRSISGVWCRRVLTSSAFVHLAMTDEATWQASWKKNMKLFWHLNHAWIDDYPEKNNQDEGIWTFSVLLFFWQLVEFAMCTSSVFAGAIFLCPSATRMNTISLRRNSSQTLYT